MINKILYITLIMLLSSCSETSDQFGGYNDPRAFDGISISNPVGIQLPVDSEQYFEGNMSLLFGNGLPKIFIIGYYDCPMLCNSIRDNVFSEIRKTNLQLGIDYEILMFSIDPEEDSQKAVLDRNSYFDRYFGDSYEDKYKKYINFMVAGSEEIEAITKTLGFEYRYDSELDQYFHPSFIYIVSDKGVVSSGFQIGSVSDIIEPEIDKARKNIASMDFDQFYTFTCMQKDIQNRNPKKAFELLQVSGLWFLSSVGFCFLHRYLSKKEIRG
tara:strand:+ start:85 stop:894 length:810 start_codon:yes stop_codon:yes gene_type:complete